MLAYSGTVNKLKRLQRCLFVGEMSLLFVVQGKGACGILRLCAQFVLVLMELQSTLVSMHVSGAPRCLSVCYSVE
jgi:hypothetical protein